MSNLNTKQWEAHVWLSRMWNKDNEIESYETRKTDIISQLSGIGKYDETFIPAQTGENAVETKNLEYSRLCSEIEKLVKEVSVANIRTLEVIQHISDAKMRGLLYDRYVNRLSWNQISEKYHYAQRQPFRYWHKCLDAVRPFITDEEIKMEVYQDDVC